MKVLEFWELIEASIDFSVDNQHIQYHYLIDELANSPLKEIYSFDKILNQFHKESYSSDLWAAAYIINGGCSDDGFDYFRAWLISKGHRTYYSVISNPEKLTDVINTKDAGYIENENFLNIAHEAYQLKTKKSNYWVSDSSLLSDPIPELVFDWSESEESLMNKYPKLVEKFW